MFKTIDTEYRKGNGFENLTGKKYGRLTVLGLSEKKSGRKSYTARSIPRRSDRGTVMGMRMRMR